MGQTNNQMTRAEAERWMSEKRFAHYLRVGHQDVANALMVYKWNASMASACMKDLGHLEVCLRNAYDRLLVSKFGTWTDLGNPLFTLEVGIGPTKTVQGELNRQSLEQIASAREKGDSHGHVVAALMFGFWSALSVKTRTATVWDVVKDAYPAGIDRGSTHSLIHDLASFRNRAAHSEPMFTSSSALARRLGQLSRLFDMLDPVAARWVGEQSAVPQILEKRPAAHLVPVPPSIHYLGLSQPLK